MLVIQSTLNIPVADGVTAVCRPPSARIQEAFLANRFLRQGKKTVNNYIPARVKFAREILFDLNGAEWTNAAGEVLPLNKQTTFTDADRAYLSDLLGDPVSTWKDLVPVNFYSTIAARFEERSEEAEDPNS